MTNSVDTCYKCGNTHGICIAPKTKEWDNCAKNCSACQFHRCKLRNKCSALYPNKRNFKKKGDKK